jgi:photosystem II stability/assembly factor-like uncharacterized protein
MKKGILIIIGIYFINLAHAQFPGVSLYDIFSTDSLSAWVVGEHGAIIHIIDEGMYWEDHSYNTDLSLNSVYFVSEQKGFIVGEEGLVLKTIDGGVSWEIIDLGVTFKLELVTFIDDQHGWIYPELYWGYGIFRTENGGDDWEFVNTEIFHPFFIDSLNGWGGYNYSNGEIVVKRSYDGGSTWVDISTHPGNDFPYFFFLDQSLGFMSIYDGEHTSGSNTYDGGLNWTQNNFYEEDFQMSDIHFLDSVNGWICGNEYIYYSNDFFNSYDGFYQLVEEFYGFSIHGISNGWAVSYDNLNSEGTVWKLDEFNDWYPIVTIGVNEIVKKDIISNYPNPFTSSTTIEYELNSLSNLQFTVYNVIGEVVHSTEERNVLPGHHTVKWSPGHLPRGLYYGMFRSVEGVSVVKMVKQ